MLPLRCCCLRACVPLCCRAAAAVTLRVCLNCSTLLCGFYPLLHSMLYIILQVCYNLAD
jgi:hypothetical protein